MPRPKHALRFLALTLALCTSVGCADPPAPAQSLAQPHTERINWLEDNRRDCGLSPLGEVVHDAAMAADQSRNTVPVDAMVRLHNRAADALLTGPEIFPTMAEQIAKAEAEVDIAMFVYDYSDAYDELTDAFARLQARQIERGATEPVVVRIVVDAMKVVANTGADMAARVFDGISRLELDPNYVQVMIATYEHLTLGNLHTKTVVIDGKTAMLGGANVQSQHDYADPWMDSFYLLEGGAAQTLLADFDHAWNKANQWVCARDADDELHCQKWDGAPGAWHAAAVLQPDWDAMGLGEACIPTIALNRVAWGGFNNNIDNPQDQGVLAAMGAAEHHIYVQTPNLNDDAVRDAIIAALQRGVEVSIVLSMGFNDGPMNLLGGTNEEVVDDLLRRAQQEAPNGADALQFRWYSQDGAHPVDGKQGASHLKYMSIDGQMAIVGSMNMDTIAWNHSRETNLAIDHEGVTAMWDAQVFQPHFERGVAP
jgi:phosphatidylserine/phosphatidylglycerophosphate/cardiolipin synthase-like enzyme